MADRVAGGFIAGDRQQHEERCDLARGQPFAVDLGLYQRGGQVALRGGPSVVGQCYRVRAEIRRYLGVFGVDRSRRRDRRVQESRSSSGRRSDGPARGCRSCRRSPARAGARRARRPAHPSRRGAARSSNRRVDGPVRVPRLRCGRPLWGESPADDVAQSQMPGSSSTIIDPKNSASSGFWSGIVMDGLERKRCGCRLTCHTSSYLVSAQCPVPDTSPSCVSSWWNAMGASRRSVANAPSR